MLKIEKLYRLKINNEPIYKDLRGSNLIDYIPENDIIMILDLIIKFCGKTKWDG